MKTGLALVLIGVAFSLTVVWYILTQTPQYWWLALVFVVVVAASAWGAYNDESKKKGDNK